MDFREFLKKVILSGYFLIMFSFILSLFRIPNFHLPSGPYVFPLFNFLKFNIILQITSSLYSVNFDMETLTPNNIFTGRIFRLVLLNTVYFWIIHLATIPLCDSDVLKMTFFLMGFGPASSSIYSYVLETKGNLFETSMACLFSSIISLITLPILGPFFNLSNVNPLALATTIFFSSLVPFFLNFLLKLFCGKIVFECIQKVTFFFTNLTIFSEVNWAEVSRLSLYFWIFILTFFSIRYFILSTIIVSFFSIFERQDSNSFFFLGMKSDSIVLAILKDIYPVVPSTSVMVLVFAQLFQMASLFFSLIFNFKNSLSRRGN